MVVLRPDHVMVGRVTSRGAADPPLQTVVTGRAVTLPCDPADVAIRRRFGAILRAQRSRGRGGKGRSGRAPLRNAPRDGRGAKPSWIADPKPIENETQNDPEHRWATVAQRCERAVETAAAAAVCAGPKRPRAPKSPLLMVVAAVMTTTMVVVVVVIMIGGGGGGGGGDDGDGANKNNHNHNHNHNNRLSKNG